MSEPDVIAWFDPGTTTGCSLYDITKNHFESTQCSAEELPVVVEALCVAYRGRLAIGYELYIQTPRPRPGSSAKPSNDAIAVIDQACARHGVLQIKGQPSSARMRGSTVVFLRRLGWYRPGLQHANDAACHLFRHLIRMKPVPENVRKALPAGY